jgi:alkyl hydroperoxide reductase subunit AhpC
LSFQAYLKGDKERLRSQQDSIEAQYKKDQDKEKWLELATNLRKKDIQNSNENLLKFIYDHPTSNYALWSLIGLFQGQGYNEIYDESFALFDDQIKESVIGANLKNQLNKLKSMNIDRAFPRLDVFTTKSNKIQLDIPNLAKENTYTLIDFWFTLCSPCIAEYEVLKDIYQKYKPQNFEVIAISVDNEAYEKKWKKHIIDNSYVWQNYLDKNAVFARNYNISYFPQNFLINAEGVIVKKNISMNDLALFLEGNL